MTINEKILDDGIRHMVWLERYKSSTVKRILGLLNKADDDLVSEISRRLSLIEDRGFDLGKESTSRLSSLLSYIRADRKAIYSELYDEHLTDLFEFAEYESDFQARLVEGAVKANGFDIELTRPTSALLKAAATSKPFQGRLLKEWYSGIESRAAQRVSDIVRIGVVEGLTTDQMVRRIRGTRVRQFRDGVLDISRRDAQSVVRTSVAHIADRAANDVWSANSDIIKGLKWVSTLDGRTSPICRTRDGKVYELGKAPPVPAHFNCRSRTIPYLGEFKTKGTRAASGGPVPEDVKYEAWLKKQTVDVQNEILGVSKAKLFRKGGLWMIYLS